jgi:hypothetical protein
MKFIPLSMPQNKNYFAGIILFYILVAVSKFR